MFIAGAFWSGLLHGDAPLYAVQPVTMFLSHAFLHGSLLHMVMNMTILLALGRFTADRYGAGVILPVFLARRGRRAARSTGCSPSGAYPMVGASGAVFALPRALDRLGLAAAPGGSGLSTAPVLRRVAGAGGRQRRRSTSG